MVLPIRYYRLFVKETMKKRDTTILAVRIKNDLLAQVIEKVAKKGVSRNSWLLWAIRQGLRSHPRREKNEAH